VRSDPPAFLHPFASPARAQFISIVRGDGALLWDADGVEYVDAMASLWYCAVGHGRVEIAEAVSRQIGEVAAYSCFEPFTNLPADQLAEQVVALTPMPSARVFFCDSGSEAVDTAMKLARLTHSLGGYPERTLVISRERGYHGTNYGGTSAQGIPANRDGWGPLVPDVVQTPGDDVEALAVLMAERSEQVAAVLVEPVQGAGGVYPPTAGYLAELRRLCDRHGALLIFDEVITGFGRLGTWFAAEHYGVVPDLTTFAKAITSGYQPLGGVLVGAKSGTRWRPTPPTCCAMATRTPATPRRAPPAWPTWPSWSARISSAAAGASAIDSVPGCTRSPPTARSTTPGATERCGRRGSGPSRMRSRCATPCSPAG
jgi:adenosylmethionine-8-amino-7-oxononanoate aminotransferase